MPPESNQQKFRVNAANRVARESGWSGCQRQLILEAGRARSGCGHFWMQPRGQYVRRDFVGFRRSFLDERQLPVSGAPPLLALPHTSASFDISTYVYILSSAPFLSMCLERIKHE